jgi:hypothetical protein
MGLARRSAARMAVGAALGVATMLGATAPALAAPVVAPASQQGTILKYVGTTPTYADCVNLALQQQSRQHADDWRCYPSNGKWDAYLVWYT